MQFHNPQAAYGRTGAPPPMHMGQYVPATLKNPPPWNAAWEESYPFAIWLQDIVLWAASTDVDPDRQAPAVVMGLSGAARELCREVDVATLQNGILADWQDGVGSAQRSRCAPSRTFSEVRTSGH